MKKVIVLLLLIFCLVNCKTTTNEKQIGGEYRKNNNSENILNNENLPLKYCEVKDFEIESQSLNGIVRCIGDTIKSYKKETQELKQIDLPIEVDLITRKNEVFVSKVIIVSYREKVIDYIRDKSKNKICIYLLYFKDLNKTIEIGSEKGSYNTPYYYVKEHKGLINKDTCK
jgi:hypothetical protein